MVVKNTSMSRKNGRPHSTQLPMITPKYSTPSSGYLEEVNTVNSIFIIRCIGNVMMTEYDGYYKCYYYSLYTGRSYQNSLFLCNDFTGCTIFYSTT